MNNKYNIAQNFSVSSGLSDTFKNLVSTDYTYQTTGVIKSVLLRNDTVFALIEQGDDSHRDGVLFNAYAFENISGLTLPELLIPTDINPIGNDIHRYVGSQVLVHIQNEVAIFATVFKKPELFSDLDPSIIRKVRNILIEDQGENADIFGPKSEKVWAQFGIVQEQIKNLKDLVFKPDEHLEKTITIEGEGNWSKDTGKVQSNETVIKLNDLLRGLNKAGMKTNDCHLPTRLFSAK